MQNGWQLTRALMTVLRNLATDRRGAAMIEYALLAGLIAVVALATLGGVGNGVKNEFSTISSKL